MRRSGWAILDGRMIRLLTGRPAPVAGWGKGRVRDLHCSAEC